MLTALMYVLVPMPYLFFGPGTSGGYADIGGTSEGWMDAGKFLTGCSAVASFAIPAILAHSGASSASATHATRRGTPHALLPAPSLPAPSHRQDRVVPRRHDHDRRVLDGAGCLAGPPVHGMCV
ncbi:unnamed protein product [Pedinophyceae sp. YPF-701]|nr:unnamed protein product [Pedinophyceae sp. YPF-701]